MDSKQVLKEHYEEMGQKFPIYQIFDRLEQSDLSAEDVAALRKEFSQLAEVFIQQELRLDPEIFQAVDYVINLGMPDAHRVASSWKTAVVSAADISRPTAKIMFTGFYQWLQETSPETRDSFFEALPQLAPSMRKLGTKGVLQILGAVKELMTHEDREVLLQSIAAYGETDAEIILGVCSIARDALRSGETNYLERLMAILPAEEIVEDQDSYVLIPEIARLCDVCNEQKELLWRHALDLILLIAEENCSSAYATARALPKRLPRLAVDSIIYFEDFAKLVRAIGIRVIGFGLKALPEFYGKYGIEKTRSFVNAAASMAKDYGVTAGQYLLEQKTVSAKKLLA